MSLNYTRISVNLFGTSNPCNRTVITECQNIQEMEVPKGDPFLKPSPYRVTTVCCSLDPIVHNLECLLCLSLDETHTTG